MKRILAVSVAAFVLSATSAYAQMGCMHGGGHRGSMGMGGMSMGGGMGIGGGGMGGGMGMGYMQQQFAQQQFMRQMYMQQVYDQQQAQAKAERHTARVAMLKERRATELAKKSSPKVNTTIVNAPVTAPQNMAEAILAKGK